ncbi:hypothetical protein HDV03_000898 [Kappamyces sp. JEL0829]|nr:hypothetical protein HDV03_000898 [Kappamyces sp. JEL0829]
MLALDPLLAAISKTGPQSTLLGLKRYPSAIARIERIAHPSHCLFLVGLEGSLLELVEVLETTKTPRVRTLQTLAMDSSVVSWKASAQELAVALHGQVLFYTFDVATLAWSLVGRTTCPAANADTKLAIHSAGLVALVSGSSVYTYSCFNARLLSEFHTIHAGQVSDIAWQSREILALASLSGLVYLVEISTGVCVPYLQSYGGCFSAE